MPFPTFQNQQYLNLETFRKNGQGVKTPVWFVQDGDVLYIWTQTDSGKAKRVRNVSRVNIAPSRGDGAPLADWVPASASRDDSPETVEHVRKLMSKKYGFLFHAFALMGKLRKAAYTTLKIRQ
ncbi:MAG: PPOX class F420-dependent oxidoreductase [Anaerolineae bacterium]|nr:PPOX class F420-dependent oxidoreductase [Anaerolineae bacterium]